MIKAATAIRVLQPGDEPALEAFLLPRLATSMFLLSNARASGLRDTGKPYTGTYAAAFQGDAIIGVVAHFWNGTLMPQVPTSVALLDRLWRAAVAASGRPVRGVVGADDQACAIKAAAGLDDADLRLDYREKLYRLDLADLIVPEPLATGAVVARPATPDDLDSLTDWGVAYRAESLGEPAKPPTAAQRRANRETTAREIDEGRYWVLEDGGRLVAMTGFNARIAEAVQVGGVYTPPPLRSRGYARCAVAGSLLGVREAGARLAILFTGEENVPAQRAYAALGFRHIGYFRLSLM
jgi:uncharacterized protein